MIFKRKLSLIMSIILLINCLAINVNANNIDYQAVIDEISTGQAIGIDEVVTNQAITTNEVTTSKDDIDIKFELLSDWGSGYSAQITITNKSDKVLKNWQLEFNFDYGIDSLWGGSIISQEAGKVIVSNAGYNKELNSNSNVIIGFNGSPGLVNKFPENYVLKYDDGSYNSSNENNETTEIVSG